MKMLDGRGTLMYLNFKIPPPSPPPKKKMSLQVRERVSDGPPSSVPRVLSVRHHPHFLRLSEGGFVGDLSLVEADGGGGGDGGVEMVPVCLPSVSVGGGNTANHLPY